MRTRSAIVSALVTAFFIPALLSAQSFQGSLRGVVKDAQGVIPGVSVALVNEANGVSRDTVTNGVGESSFPAVDPGNSTVKAAVPGYKTFERKGVRIGTQEAIGLDIALEIGALEETITVTGESPLIDTMIAQGRHISPAVRAEILHAAGEE